MLSNCEEAGIENNHRGLCHGSYDREQEFRPPNGSPDLSSIDLFYPFFFFFFLRGGIFCKFGYVTPLQLVVLHSGFDPGPMDGFNTIKAVVGVRLNGFSAFRVSSSRYMATTFPVNLSSELQALLNISLPECERASVYF